MIETNGPNIPQPRILPEGYTSDPTRWRDPVDWPVDGSDQVYVPASESLVTLQKSYANGVVRRYWDPRPGTIGEAVMRTDIDLPDGRTVSVHRNPYGSTMTSYFDQVQVMQDGNVVGQVDLSPIDNYDPNPRYAARVEGRELDAMPAPQGRNIDLAIADALLKGAVSREVGGIQLNPFGSEGNIAKAVSAMKQGWTEADIANLFKKEQSRSRAAVVEQDVQYHLQERIRQITEEKNGGSAFNRFLGRLGLRQ